MAALTPQPTVLGRGQHGGAEGRLAAAGPMDHPTGDIRPTLHPYVASPFAPARAPNLAATAPSVAASSTSGHSRSTSYGEITQRSAATHQLPVGDQHDHDAPDHGGIVFRRGTKNRLRHFGQKFGPSVFHTCTTDSEQWGQNRCGSRCLESGKADRCRKDEYDNRQTTEQHSDHGF